MAIKVLVKDFTPELSAGIRFLSAGSLMLAFARFKGFEFLNNAIDILRVSFVGLLLLSGCNGIVTWTMQWVDSGIASIILTLFTIFTTIIEVLAFRKKVMGIYGWIGLFVSFSGVTVLVYFGNSVGSIDLKGAILLVLAAISLAYGAVYSKKSSRQVQ